MVKSDLPFGSEFSPNQIDLVRALELAERHAGNKADLEDALRTAFFDRPSTDASNRAKLAMNCRLGLIGYQLLDENLVLTALAHQLLALKGDVAAVYRAFARHVLLNLRGLAVLQTAQDLHARNERVTLTTFPRALEERGIRLPRGNKNLSTMRLWLAKAGVVASADWEVNEGILEAIVGASQAEVDALAMFTPQQKAFLKAIGNLSSDRDYSASDVEQLAAATYGVAFNEKALPRTVLFPLRDAGYIDLKKGTQGRGGKTFQIALTEKLRVEVIEPLLSALEQQVAADLRPMLRKPLTEILQEVGSDDRHKKGLALEALAFYLMRLVDLRYVATRLRGERTGGAEVDLVFEGSRLLFSRWQVQCKNTGRVNLDDVAKEVGLTIQLKSNVVVIVSTGKIGNEARRYARTVVKDTHLNVALIDRTDLEQIAACPPMIADILNREASRAMQIKKLPLDVAQGHAD